MRKTFEPELVGKPDEAFHKPSLRHQLSQIPTTTGGGASRNDLEKPGDPRLEFRDDVLDRVGIHIDPPNEQHVVSAPFNNEAKPRKAAFCQFGENLNDVLVPPANERRALLLEPG